MVICWKKQWLLLSFILDVIKLAWMDLNFCSLHIFFIYITKQENKSLFSHPKKWGANVYNSQDDYLHILSFPTSWIFSLPHFSYLPKIYSTWDHTNAEHWTVRSTQIFDFFVWIFLKECFKNISGIFQKLLHHVISNSILSIFNQLNTLFTREI